MKFSVLLHTQLVIQVNLAVKCTLLKGDFHTQDAMNWCTITYIGADRTDHYAVHHIYSIIISYNELNEFQRQSR